ncbi:MAG: sulfatase [Planctomycetota bacterium]
MSWNPRRASIVGSVLVVVAAICFWIARDGQPSSDHVVLDRVIDLCSLRERQLRSSPDPNDSVPGELILAATPRPFLAIPPGEGVVLRRVAVHENARLEAFLGVDPESWSSHPVPVTFSVALTLPGSGEPVAADSVQMKVGSSDWQPFSLTLPKTLVGQRVTIELATDAPGNPPIRCGFGAPVLRSDGHGAPRSEATIPGRAPVLDLLETYRADKILSATGELEPSVIAFSLGSERVEGSGRRRALVTTPGSRVGWDLDAPPHAELTIDLGVAQADAASDGVTFRVSLDDRLLFERHISDIGVWVPARVRLSDSDEPVTGKLILETNAGPAGDATGDIAAWAGAVVVAESFRPVPPAPTREQPNILLITVDTLRADRLSVYGYERPTSPNLDRFAEAGLLFENVTAPSSWTWPSTATILTGLTPPAHGVNDGNSSFLSDEIETLAEKIRRRGLLTYAVTANPLVGPEKNFDQGFNVFDTVPWSSAASVNTRFLHWLDARPGMQFFAYLHYFDPHSPYDDPRDPDGALFDPNYDGDLDGQSVNELISQINWKQPPESGPIEFTQRDIEHLSARYDGCINYWDEQFGRLIEELKRRDLWDDTLVILTSDHGEAFLEHGLIAHVSSLYEEVLHVPLIIGGGAFRGEPRRIDALVPLTSILPTVLRRLKAPVELRLPGLDLLGRSPGVDVAFATTLLGRYGPDRIISPMGAIRTPDQKLIITTIPRVTELYDLDSDPAEKDDLANEEPALVGTLRGELTEWTVKESQLAPKYRVGIDESTQDTLERLGYVGGHKRKSKEKPKDQEKDD